MILKAIFVGKKVSLNSCQTNYLIFFSFPEKRMGCYKVKKMISWDMFVLLRYLYEEVITFYREIRIKIAQMLLFLICYFYLRNVDTNLHLLHYDYTPCIQMKVVINF